MHRAAFPLVAPPPAGGRRSRGDVSFLAKVLTAGVQSDLPATPGSVTGKVPDGGFSVGSHPQSTPVSVCTGDRDEPSGDRALRGPSDGLVAAAQLATRAGGPVTTGVPDPQPPRTTRHRGSTRHSGSPGARGRDPQAARLRAEPGRRQRGFRGRRSTASAGVSTVALPNAPSVKGQSP